MPSSGGTILQRAIHSFPWVRSKKNPYYPRDYLLIGAPSPGLLASLSRSLLPLWAILRSPLEEVVITLWMQCLLGGSPALDTQQIEQAALSSLRRGWNTGTGRLSNLLKTAQLTEAEHSHEEKENRLARRLRTNRFQKPQRRHPV